ncbi:glutamate dehydrogenase [Streptomyces sp. NPDC015346]|uniref:terpene synthase family protein n=1 Tax=Streptomyces sp. NPDC015346 TaxID=3364954 RepID=UPI0037035843
MTVTPAAGPLTITLPPLYCPLQGRTHPDVELMAQRAVDWMAGYGFASTPVERARLEGTHGAVFASSLCPDAPTELLQLLVDWTYLTFTFDDDHCNDGVNADADEFVLYSNRLMRTLEAGDAALMDPADPYTAPWIDLTRRLRHAATPSQMQRWTTGMRKWLDGEAWQISYESAKIMPDLSTFAAMRILSCAGEATFSHIGIVNGFELHATEADSPLVRAASEAAILTAAWDDDLFSYGKDLFFARAADDTRSYLPVNAVDVVMAEHGCSLDEALTRCAELHDTFMCIFLRLRDKALEDRPSSELRRYLACLGYVLRGNIEFGLKAPRYTNPDAQSPGAVRTIGGWAESPSTHAHHAPDIPSITWWWNLADKGEKLDLPSPN